MSVRVPEVLDAESVAAFVVELEASDGACVVRGASAETFCRGLHVEGEDPIEVGDAFAEMLVRLSEARSVAYVDGVAQGGGLGVAAACDVVLATPSARFSLPEMLFGLVPAAIWPVLRRRVSEGVLCRWAKTGLSFDSAEALRVGLVDEVVEPSAVRGRIATYRRALGRPSRQAHVRLRALQGAALREAITAGLRQTADALRAPDVAEARRRFAQGEAPWMP